MPQKRSPADQGDVQTRSALPTAPPTAPSTPSASTPGSALSADIRKRKAAMLAREGADQHPILTFLKQLLQGEGKDVDLPLEPRLFPRK